MSLADQLAVVRAEIPSMVATAFSRMPIDDDSRWDVLALVPDATEPPAVELRTEAVALRARLWLLATEGSPTDLVDALAAMGSDPALVEAEARDPHGTEVIPAVGSHDDIRAVRPWAVNPTWVGLVDGSLSKEGVVAYVDQWRLHLAFGSALFAAMLGHLRPGDPDHGRLVKDVVATVGPTNTRAHLGNALRNLRVALVGDPGPDHPAPLPETARHLAIMGEVSRHRSAHEAFAAVSALKPGFSALCAEAAEALVRRWGLDAGAVEFFVRQRDRADEGANERAAIARSTVDPQLLATAFRDGLYSYHHILDGIWRSIS